MSATARHPDLAALGETVTANPTHVWIEPTNRCNTRCTHCGHFYDKFGQDMGEDLYAKVAASALDRVERVELIGYGEPLMARGYHQMFDDLAGRGIQIFTTSNGILLRNDELVGKLVRANFVLCLSIDGARAETLEFVRPYIKWPKMIETLECIKRCADAATAAGERRFKFRFNFVAMKQNIGDLPDLVRLAHTYGAEEIFILPLGGEEVFEKVRGQSLHDSPELVSPAFMRALPLATRLGVTVTVPSSFRPLIVAGPERRRGIKGRVRAAGRMVRLGANLLQRDGVGRLIRRLTTREPRAKAGVSYCIMPWQDAYFASDGTVFPCCIMGEKLGDMARQSWDEVWNGQQYRNLRRTVHSWNPTSVCRTCPLPTGINGGNELQYADYFGRFRAEAVALDDAAAVRLGAGFYAIERHADGAPSHVWMAGRGEVSLAVPRRAKFVRVRLVARSPVHEPNPGTCVVEGLPPEPFDNSCDQVNFPVRGAARDAEGRVRLTLTMENEHHVEGDARALSLGVSGFEFLF